MRRFLLLLTILCTVLISTVQAQRNARLTAPKDVCVNGYASMHAFLEETNPAPPGEVMVNWTIVRPDGTIINHRYDQEAGYPGGHHPDFRYMSPTHGQSVTFEVLQEGQYTVTVTIEYMQSGTLRTSNSRTKQFTAYDCSMDECEGTFTPSTNFKETFGTFVAGGPRRQVAAPATVEYNFLSSGNLADNDYSIYYNSRLGGRPEWDNVGDHTDNGNGGMLIANSSDEPKLFYRRPVNNLCPGAKYNFSAWSST
ncbi:hypothetical protein [Chitinophaga sp. XS-30]|uniref:hypothetical protein n=1 Tax=Chitinophaga sp. XS-30 TaxID=2604421 RepID=UPI0011DC97BD|nr:hypothetical protein [Chitinophaga sp. XS-30]QEH42262.1 hypothetical protein FW415_15850 [Chitinophaga sp. XS-30]